MADIEQVRREACAIGRHDMAEWEEAEGQEVARCQVPGCNHIDRRPLGSGRLPPPAYDPYGEL